MRIEKTKIVAAIWALGMILFAGWMMVTLIGIWSGLIMGLVIRFQAYADLLAWLIVGGFALSGSIISIGFVLKFTWKLSDGAIIKKLPKIMKTGNGAVG